MYKKLFAVGALLTTFTTSALAYPVEWTFNNLVFDDGTTVTGSFTYDTGVGIRDRYDMTNTTVTCGELCQGTVAQLDEADRTLDDALFWGRDSSGTIVTIRLVYWLPLPTYTEGEIPLAFGRWSTAIGNEQDQFAYITNPSLYPTLTAVPLPAAVWLFGSALGGLGWWSRRKNV